MSRKNNPYNLTDRQRAFCEEYVKDFNGTNACIRAGYSEKTARGQGSRLLTKANISKYIEELRTKAFKRNQIEIDEMISILSDIARFDPNDLNFEDSNKFENLSQLTLGARYSLEGHKVYDDFIGFGKERKKVGEIIEMKYGSKRLDAIEKLMRWRGAYDKDNTQKNGSDNVVIYIPDNGRG